MINITQRKEGSLFDSSVKRFEHAIGRGEDFRAKVRFCQPEQPAQVPRERDAADEVIEQPADGLHDQVVLFLASESFEVQQALDGVHDKISKNVPCGGECVDGRKIDLRFSDVLLDQIDGLHKGPQQRERQITRRE